MEVKGAPCMLKSAQEVDAPDPGASHPCASLSLELGAGAGIWGSVPAKALPGLPGASLPFS